MIAEADYTGEVFEQESRRRQILDTRPEGSGEGLVSWRYRRRQFAEGWLGDTLRDLRQVAALRDNWDSYGGKAVHPISVVSAGLLLRELSDHGDISKPVLSALPSGNVLIGWDDDEKTIVIECFPDGMFRYSFVHDRAPSWDDEGVIDERLLVTQLIAEWLHGG